MKSLKAGMIFIISAIILGAFSAHALKEIFTPDRLTSFKTGATYLMYSGISLLALEALRSKFSKRSFKIGTTLLITGSLLFSGSIFLLCWTNHLELTNYTKFLGPITPIGGVFMILSWCVLLVNIFNRKCPKDTLSKKPKS